MIKLKPVESNNGYNLIYMPDVEFSEVFELRSELFTGRNLYFHDLRDNKHSTVRVHVKKEFLEEFKKCLVVNGTLFPELIIYEDGSSLLLFKYNEIIGSRWIKVFPPGEADEFFGENVLQQFDCPECKRKSFLWEGPNRFHPETYLAYCRFTDCKGFTAEGTTKSIALNNLREAIKKAIK